MNINNIFKIYTWDGDYSFDEELKKIEHYKIHPEMLPFVGANYKNCRILLVGESHYVGNLKSEEKAYLQDNDVNNWYCYRVPEEFGYASWFNTRYIIWKFLNKRRSKSYTIFSKPANAIIDELKLTNVCDSEIFSVCAFMNYFQRPSCSQGDTITNSDKDNKIAYQIFFDVVKILNPKTIIFLSKNAFESYELYNSKNSLNAEFTCHPTSPYWYKDDGELKFRQIIKNVPINETLFCRYTLPDLEVIKANLPKWATTLISKEKRRFQQNKITVKLYSKKNKLEEIVFHKIINGRKIGVGYVFKYYLLWIWDYDKKDYIDNIDIDIDSTKIKDFSESIIRFLNQQ